MRLDPPTPALEGLLELAASILGCQCALIALFGDGNIWWARAALGFGLLGACILHVAAARRRRPVAGGPAGTGAWGVGRGRRPPPPLGPGPRAGSRRACVRRLSNAAPSKPAPTPPPPMAGSSTPKTLLGGTSRGETGGAREAGAAGSPQPPRANAPAGSARLAACGTGGRLRRNSFTPLRTQQPTTRPLPTTKPPPSHPPTHPPTTKPQPTKPPAQPATKPPSPPRPSFCAWTCSYPTTQPLIVFDASSDDRRAPNPRPRGAGALPCPRAGCAAAGTVVQPWASKVPGGEAGSSPPRPPLPPPKKKPTRKVQRKAPGQERRRPVLRG